MTAIVHVVIALTALEYYFVLYIVRYITVVLLLSVLYPFRLPVVGIYTDQVPAERMEALLSTFFYDERGHGIVVRQAETASK